MEFQHVARLLLDIGKGCPRGETKALVISYILDELNIQFIPWEFKLAQIPFQFTQNC
jgi:hypothetical protein